jgi:hypothetical protein
LYFVNNNSNVHVAPMLLEKDNQSIGHNDQDPIKFIIDEKGYKDTNKSCIEDKLLKRKDKHRQKKGLIGCIPLFLKIQATKNQGVGPYINRLVTSTLPTKGTRSKNQVTNSN